MATGGGGQPASLKGNPASKRMRNAALKARRSASWTRGERRKEARVATQKEAQRRNDRLRAERQELKRNGRNADAADLKTPWEFACAKRAASRFERLSSRGGQS